MLDLFDDYEVLEDVGRKNQNRYYKVRCKICGHIKECSIANLRKQDNHHSPLNCSNDYYKENVGKTFGDYACESIISGDNYPIAVVKCNICGNVKNIPARDLRPISHWENEGKKRKTEQYLGQFYGDLEVVEYVGDKYGTYAYKCRCVKCGIESVRKISTIKRGIYHGRECFKQIPDSEIKNTIATRFNCIQGRCNNPNSTKYKYYGGRGVKCMYRYAVDLYLDFEKEFREHAKIYGIKNSTFDRIDVNGNYEKDNLRIVTRETQTVNTTRSKIIIIFKDDQVVASNCPFKCGEALGVNGRSMGNMVRGKSKSCGGWRLKRIIENNDNLEEVLKSEGVTTKLFFGEENRKDCGEIPKSVAPSISEEIKR